MTRTETAIFEPTETWVFEAAGTAILGNYSNTGTATGTGSDAAGHFRTTTASDSSNYTGAAPQIAITKNTIDGSVRDTTKPGDGLSILTGELVTWRYSVRSTGNVPLSNISVTDDQGATPAPELGVDGVHNVGDININDLLESTERWYFRASGTAWRARTPTRVRHPVP